MESSDKELRKDKSAFTDLVNGPVAKTLLLFSLPFMASTLLQTFYSTVDTIVVGQFLGSSGLSAVSNGSQLMQTMYMLCIGFSNAGQVLIAQAEGAGLPDKTRKTSAALMQIVFLVSLIEGLVCIFGARSLLTLLATPEEAIDQAVLYVVICGIGMIPTGFYNMFSAIFRGMGDSRHPLIFVAIASVINTVLDVLFIGVFGWNVAGAALATVIGQISSVIFSVQLLAKNQDSFHVDFRLAVRRAQGSVYTQIIKIGIPLSIQSAAVNFSFLFVSRMVNSLGLSVSAAFGVAQKIRNIPGVLTQGLSMGSGSMLGQNLGAGRNDRVQKTVTYGIFFCTVINLVFGLIFTFAPVLCFRMFTQDETVLAYAEMCMFTLVLELPARCVMTSCGQLISALGFVQLSMVISFIDAFVGRILCCWLLGSFFGLGALGYFMGFSIGTYLSAIPQFVYFISGLWKKRKKLV